MSEQPPIEHLGDGVYCESDNGFQLKLSANSHTNPTDVVYLDVGVLRNLFDYAVRAGLLTQKEVDNG